MDERFPLGKPINRPPPAKNLPEREEVRRGIFSVGGKLQTELPLRGPRRAPEALPDIEDGVDVVLYTVASWPFPKSPKGTP